MSTGGIDTDADAEIAIGRFVLPLSFIPNIEAKLDECLFRP